MIPNLPEASEPRSPQTQTLARLAARAIFRDAGRGLQSLGPITLRQLIDYSGDGALRADVPPRSPGRKVEINDLGAARQYSSLQTIEAQRRYRKLCCFRTELARLHWEK